MKIKKKKLLSLFLAIFLATGYANSPKEPRSKQVLANSEKNEVYVERLDAGVEIVPFTEEFARKANAMGLYEADPGFAKWCVIFHDIPGSPPYGIKQKRLIQPLPDHYYNCQALSPETLLECKKLHMPAYLVVSVRGYLMGEKITMRLHGQGKYREAVFYPRPLILKRKSGELLANGDLLCAKPGHTSYGLNVFGVRKEEKYKLISRSGKEVLSYDAAGPMECSITPEVIGMIKGIARTELQFEDGTSSSVEFPWGYELDRYRRGDK